MSIGAVAAQAGRRPSSIRYYEQIGLLPRPDRVSGRRVYGPDTVRTLAVIETGQRAGLTLDEIRDLLSASDGDQAAIDRLREVALRKLPEVRELIERTEIVRDWLEAAARCECPTLDECPLFDDPARLPQKVPGSLAGGPGSRPGGHRARPSLMAQRQAQPNSTAPVTAARRRLHRASLDV
jgi:MerR family redox-sensitive transcriptional activator SoxR